MKKLRKIVLVVLGAVAGLAVVLMIGLNFFLSVDKMAARLEQEVEKSTGAEVEIGDAGLSWWPRLGIRLEDIRFQGTGAGLTRVTGRANRIGSYSGQARGLQVRVPLVPLLKKQMVVKAAVLRGVNLTMEQNGESLRLADGRLDVADLQLDLDNLREGAGPEGAGPGTPVGQRIPEDLTLAFQGQMGAYAWQGQELRDIRFRGELDARILTVEEMSAEMGEGSLRGNLEIDYERDPRGLLDFAVEADKVAATELLATCAPAVAGCLQTDLDGRLRGHMILGEEPVMLSSLMVTGDLGSTEGVLQARQWLRDVLPYLGTRQDLAEIRFHRLRHDLRVERGRYHVSELVLDGPDTRWDVTGSVGLDGDLDLNARILLPKGFTPNLGQWSMLAEALRDEDGRVQLDLVVRGNAAKPQIGLNLEGLKGAAGSEAGDAVKKGLGGLLDKWKSR
ncbi:hypothetical protein CSB20_06605 [bacterium DOLZORAL124_64_63]|nr:MAG: hypothetical protein CSB20_06605 [bacterium DOLZORAL124_64_63]